MSSNTVHLHRVFMCPPERAYRAFLDPQAMVKWLPPHGFIGEVHEMDAREGGGYRMSFTNFSSGQRHSFGGRYIKLEPNKVIEYTDKFDDPDLPGEMQVRIVLREVSCGTEVKITQSGLPSVIPVESCYLGWQESLQLLANLINVTIPDEG